MAGSIVSKCFGDPIQYFYGWYTK